MWIFRMVVTNLVAAVLRPLMWAGLFGLAVWFVVTVPARLWTLYIDSHASAGTVSALNWATGVALAITWLSFKGRAMRRAQRR